MRRYIAIFLTTLSLVEAQSGASPKESLSPQMYEQLRGQTVPPVDLTLVEIRNQLRVFTAQHQMLYQQLAVVQQHLSDIDKQLATNRLEIDASTSSSLNERLVKLEDFEIAHIKAEEAAATASDRRTQEFLSWLRAGVVGLLGLVGNEAWKRWRDRQRRMRREGAVDHKLDGMAETISELRDNTNGRLDELLRSNGAQERAAGVKEGRQRKTDGGA